MGDNRISLWSTFYWKNNGHLPDILLDQLGSLRSCFGLILLDQEVYCSDDLMMLWIPLRKIKYKELQRKSIISMMVILNEELGQNYI